MVLKVWFMPVCAVARLKSAGQFNSFLNGTFHVVETLTKGPKE